MNEKPTPGILYVVSTPIGNLGDMTYRAVNTLKEVDLIAAEDTRTTHNLLAHYDIATPATPYHQHNVRKKTEKLIGELMSGKNVAVVSDAGTPGISDPGHELVEACIDKGITITGIPGPNAMIDALVISGIATLRFSFEGFPPRQSRDRKSLFRALASEPRTMVFYESPHRILASLKDMQHHWGDRKIAVVREATKKFEEVRRGVLPEIIEYFTEKTPRGEFVIVIEGASDAGGEIVDETGEIESLIGEYVASGMSERDAVKRVTAEKQASRREVYQCMLKLKGEAYESI